MLKGLINDSFLVLFSGESLICLVWATLTHIDLSFVSVLGTARNLEREDDSGK